MAAGTDPKPPALQEDIFLVRDGNGRTHTHRLVPHKRLLSPCWVRVREKKVAGQGLLAWPLYFLGGSLLLAKVRDLPGGWRLSFDPLLRSGKAAGRGWQSQAVTQRGLGLWTMAAASPTTRRKQGWWVEGSRERLVVDVGGLSGYRRALLASTITQRQKLCSLQTI